VKGDHIDSTSEDFAFDGAYHKTTAESDSAYMSKKYIDDMAGGLVAQSVKGDHVDSTAEDFVFDNAYEGTSVEPDSQYSTHNWVQVEIEDSLDEVYTDLALFDTNYVQLNATNLTIGTSITMPDNGWAGLGSGAGRIVFDDQTTDEVNILDANVGIGTATPSSIIHIKANIPGTVGSHPAGQLIIQNPANSMVSNVVITAYESDAGGVPDQQLWYLGSSSGSNSNITFLNRRNACLNLGTNNLTRLTILETGNIGIGTTAPPERLSVVGNIATGDTAAGDVDVFHYFSTNGSWVTEYLKWDDGVGRFEISDDFDIGGNLTLSGTATIPNLIVTTDVNIADNAVKDSSIANNITIDHAAETDSAGKA